MKTTREKDYCSLSILESLRLFLQCTGTRRANNGRAAFLGTFSAVGKSASPAGANTGKLSTEQTTYTLPQTIKETLTKKLTLLKCPTLINLPSCYSMSVYTTIEKDELETFLTRYDVGQLVSYQGISAGIENTNYFVTTEQNGQENQFVLTIFETHDAEEMPYFLDLMAHLNEHQVPSAHPIKDNNGQMLQDLKTKPAALVQRLQGSSITETTSGHCAKLGAALGDLHTAGLSFDQDQENTRGPHWWHETTLLLEDKLSSDDLTVLHEEMKFQESQCQADIPRGLIHADLFRDNALWHENELSGIIDFYFASTDVLLYDVAVTVNDWCSAENGQLEFAKVDAFLKAYHQHRALSDSEKALWPVMLRAGALRFWLSRLYAVHFPKEGEMTHIKDPQEFKTILLHRRNETKTILNHWV